MKKHITGIFLLLSLISSGQLFSGNKKKKEKAQIEQKLRSFENKVKDSMIEAFDNNDVDELTQLINNNNNIKHPFFSYIDESNTYTGYLQNITKETNPLIITMLINLKVNPNIIFSDSKKNLLMIATKCNDEMAVKLLTRAGGNPYISCNQWMKTQKGFANITKENCFDIARNNGNEEIKLYLRLLDKQLNSFIAKPHNFACRMYIPTTTYLIMLLHEPDLKENYHTLDKSKLKKMLINFKNSGKEEKLVKLLTKIKEENILPLTSYDQKVLSELGIEFSPEKLDMKNKLGIINYNHDCNIIYNNK